MPGMFDDIPITQPPTAQPAAAGMFDDIPITRPRQAPVAAAPGMFDDLIPKRAPSPGLFDDLIPKQPAAPADTSQFSPFEGASNAAASGFAQGVPIVGPGFDDLLNKGVAGIMTLAGSRSYPENLARVASQEATDNEAHPMAHTVGSVAGNIVGTAPAVAAAPEAFGLGGGALAARALAGAATSGGIGAADSAVRGNDPLLGGAIGAAGGAATPIVGAALGGAVARGLNAWNGGVQGVADSGAATILRGAVEQQGVPAAREVLDQLGPLGTFGETNPSAFGYMQSLAAAPGPAKAQIADVVGSRAAGANGRLEDVMNATVGPDVSPLAHTAEVRAEQTATVNPMYSEAFSGSSRPDTSGALAFIAGEMAHAPPGSPLAGVLTRARDQLIAHDPDTNVATITQNPRSIYNTMQQMRVIGDRGEQGLGVQPGTADAGAATMIANHLDQALGEAAPGYDQANRVYGHYSDRLANIEHGTNALDAGKGAVRPDDLAARINGNATGQAQDIGVGMRGTLQAAVGTAGNDLAALQKLTQGEGTFTPGRTSGQPSYNEQKLGMVFGVDNAARLRGAVNSEQQMQSNYVKLLGGAQSDFRAAGRRQLEQPTSLIDQYVQPNVNLAALPATLGLRGLRAGLNALGGGDVGPRNAALGAALTRQGPAASALLDAIEQSSAQRAQNAATAQPLGNLGGVFAGLSGSQAAQDRYNAPAAPPPISIGDLLARAGTR